MSFKPFFVHKFHGTGKMPNRHARGFTAHIKPSDQLHKVLMSVAWCSPKDQFNKKTGREQSQDSPDNYELVNKRDVPNLLAGCEQVCALTVDHKPGTWYYIYKYML